MDPTDLPEEVAERIFILLPVEDVLSCCLVNSRWRDSVNKNIIWKRHCNPNLHLESMPNLVKPAFEVPKSDCEDLSPICKYRLSYMREIHLRNNFRHKHCVEYKFSRGHIEKTEFLDKYLLLNDSYRNMFHVWDIHGSPIQIQSVPYLLQQMCTETFQTIGDCLLIVQCNLLQVYFVVDGMFTLKLCRIFDKEEEFSHTIPASDMMTSWYTSNIGLYPCDFTSINETVGKYFIGIVEPFRLKESVMHIWDFESGKKLKEDRIPGVEESIENICCGKNSEYLYIALYLHMFEQSSSDARCKIFCYNLKTLQYTQFYVESNHSIPFMLFEEKVVILPCDQWENSGSYLFLDSKTGKKIVEKKFDYPMNPKALDVYKSQLVFGSSHTVTVVDLDSQEEITVLPVDFEVMEVYLLDSDILLVGGVDYHFVVEVWDIKRHYRLYTLKEKAILLSGRSLPRLCLQGMYNIHVLQFW
uniref:F-box domain-containing protein n=1 Tax=Homalodisca liturata TaxID=320908 RepID=A0A1B6IRX0_9HEMI